MQRLGTPARGGRQHGQLGRPLACAGARGAEEGGEDGLCLGSAELPVATGGQVGKGHLQGFRAREQRLPEVGGHRARAGKIRQERGPSGKRSAAQGGLLLGGGEDSAGRQELRELGGGDQEALGLGRVPPPQQRSCLQQRPRGEAEAAHRRPPGLARLADEEDPQKPGTLRREERSARLLVLRRRSGATLPQHAFFQRSHPAGAPSPPLQP
mmetsp:Transcript_100781/g.310700  ORF Transcript_100781/g.310700 Transcript_100781/m.310700 type:complete len:211 (+) Transcript_100781:473-1105(+)